MKFTLLFLPILFFTLSGFSQENYYWYGGQGNWSDLNSWRNEMGMIPTTLPSENVNVIFNANSFLNEYDTVFVDDVYIVCHDMKWEGLTFPVVFHTADNLDPTPLLVFGSIQLHTWVEFDFYGEIVFKSMEDGNSINLMDKVILNHITFSGEGGEWTLLGDLIMGNNDVSTESLNLVLEQGSIIGNSHYIQTGAILSNNTDYRKLNLIGCSIALFRQQDFCWDIDLENLDFTALGSDIFINGELSTFKMKNGTDVFLQDIWLNAEGIYVSNSNNQLSYNYINMNNPYCSIGGNFIATKVFINGNHCSIFGEQQIDEIEINADSLAHIHFTGNLTLVGDHYFEFANLTGDISIFSDNVFDTLIVDPPWDLSSISTNLLLKSGKTQTINDSLYLRGNQCSNIVMNATNYGEMAYLKKDTGTYDVNCNFLNIGFVEAQSEYLNFYAGASSSYMFEPPPGWIFENDTSYYFGFNGMTYEACLGDTIILDASCFNGAEQTLYYWNGDTVPGEITFNVWEPQTVSIVVKYGEGCYFADYASIEFDSCENFIRKFLDLHTVTIFPNPSRRNISIQVNQDLNLLSLKLIGVEGKKVFESPASKLLINDNILRLNDLKVPGGIYFLQLNFKEGIVTKKIVVK